MKTILAANAVMAALCMSACAVRAAESRVYERDGYTLDFQDAAGTTDQALADRMAETFFAVYPRLAADFNSQAPRRVTFIMDPALQGVAGTDGDIVVYSSAYFAAHPGDIDVVTHEIMHVVQAYGDNDVPGWLVEGVADYARQVYGVDNAGGGWSLPAFSPDQRREAGYRGAARFLVWLESHGHSGVVKTLDARMRDGTYSEQDWQIVTGKTLPELWAAYAAAPEL